MNAFLVPPPKLNLKVCKVESLKFQGEQRFSNAP